MNYTLRRFVTEKCIEFMKWNGCECVPCKRNAFLIRIMNKYGLSMDEVNELVNKNL